MFAKLLKHELKSTGGLLSILSASALGVGVLGGFLLRFVMNRPDMSDATEVLAIVAIVSMPFIFLSVLAYAMGGQIYLATQFYRSKFTDRGYLTFTLPVKTWQIYLSSLINMALWSLVIYIVTIASIFATIFIALYNTAVWHEMMQMGIYFPMEDMMASLGYSGWTIAQSVVGFFSSNVTMITGITLGCVVARKHKVLASIGFYFAISTVIAIINSTITISTMFATMGTQLDSAYISGTLIELGVILGGSVTSILLMKKNLNLP